MVSGLKTVSLNDLGTQPVLRDELILFGRVSVTVGISCL